jgi:hypothetical protein
MTENIKPKEATAIINSLIGGVVPKIGVNWCSTYYCGTLRRN